MLQLFTDLTKPLKRHLNSSNVNFLHNLVFSSGFFGGNLKEKNSLKMVEIGFNYDDITSADQCFVHENATNCVFN